MKRGVCTKGWDHTWHDIIFCMGVSVLSIYTFCLDNRIFMLLLWERGESQPSWIDLVFVLSQGIFIDIIIKILEAIHYREDHCPDFYGWNGHWESIFVEPCSPCQIRLAFHGGEDALWRKVIASNHWCNERDWWPSMKGSLTLRGHTSRLGKVFIVKRLA